MSATILPAPLAGSPPRVLLPLTLLVAFGAAVLYSAAAGDFGVYAESHLIRYAVFLVMALVISVLPRELVQRGAYPAYAVILVMLIGVEAIGGISGGSQRWLDLGFVRLQPSELMKPAIVLVLARFYSALPASMTESWRALLPAAALVAVPVGLVLLQPDLGTGLAITFGGVVTVYLAGLPGRWFAGGALAALIAAPLAYFFALHDYQRQRVLTFLDPESDPLGTGYHITQSKIAIG
ncbi:MAG: rod shape-determining protein RodA, partial [Sphingomonadales bacterium 32-68-7]